VADESVPPPLGEILAEEIDVEKMLISEPDKWLDEVDEVRGASLDTDDAQTEQNLRPTQPPRQAFSSLLRRPSDILKEFQESSVILNRSSLPLVAPPKLFSRPAVPVGNTQRKRGNVPLPSPSRNVPDAYRLAEPPRTPLPRPRKNSVSSTDSFPVSGTRASALSKRIQQQEKHSPYQPPPGTRAAKLARSNEIKERFRR